MEIVSPSLVLPKQSAALLYDKQMHRLTNHRWRVWSQNAINAKVKKLSYPREKIDDRHANTIPLLFVCKMRCTRGIYISFCKHMEVELYLPVYRRSFRGGNSIFSPWRLSRFVTKLFRCAWITLMYRIFFPISIIWATGLFLHYCSCLVIQWIILFFKESKLANNKY